eukprot:jgi/Galph1/761/GphlegSOOS_G5501.1
MTAELGISKRELFVLENSNGGSGSPVELESEAKGIKMERNSFQQSKEKTVAIKEEGNALFRAGRYHLAAKAYTKALSLTDPNDCLSNTILLSNRSQCLLDMQQFELAIEDCTRAIEYTPNHAKSYFRRAQALEALGNYEAALSDLEVAVSFEPDSPAVQSGLDRIRIRISILSRKEERYKKEEERRHQEKERRKLKKERERIRKQEFLENYRRSKNDEEQSNLTLGSFQTESSFIRSNPNFDGEWLQCSAGSGDVNDFIGLGSNEIPRERQVVTNHSSCGERFSQHASSSSSWSSVSSVSGTEEDNKLFNNLSVLNQPNMSKTQLRKQSTASPKSSPVVHFSTEKLDSSTYPVRPGTPDCMYYLKTGKCNYGSRCKFSHPPRDERLIKALGRRDCFDYLQFGRCPYGKSCKYNHPSGSELHDLGLKPEIHNSTSILGGRRKETRSPFTRNLSHSYPEHELRSPLNCVIHERDKLESGYRASQYLSSGDLPVTDPYQAWDIYSRFPDSNWLRVSDASPQVDGALLNSSIENNFREPCLNSTTNSPDHEFWRDDSILQDTSLLYDYADSMKSDSYVNSLQHELDILNLGQMENKTNGHWSLSQKSSWSPSVDLSSPRFSIEGGSPLLGGFSNVWRLEPSECEKKSDRLRQISSSSSLSSSETNLNESSSVSSLSSLPAFSYLQASGQDSHWSQRLLHGDKFMSTVAHSNATWSNDVSSLRISSYWNSPGQRS